MNTEKMSAEMRGKTFLYHGIEHIVKSVQSNGDSKVHIVTNRTTISLTPREVKTDFLPIEGEASEQIALTKLSIIQDIRSDGAPVKKLAEVLMETIEKV